MPFTIAGCPLEFEDETTPVGDITSGDIIAHDDDAYRVRMIWIGRAICDSVTGGDMEYLDVETRVHRAVPRERTDHRQGPRRAGGILA